MAYFQNQFVKSFLFISILSVPFLAFASVQDVPTVPQSDVRLAAMATDEHNVLTDTRPMYLLVNGQKVEIERVEVGRYANIHDSAAANFVFVRPQNAQVVAGLLDAIAPGRLGADTVGWSAAPQKASKNKAQEASLVAGDRKMVVFELGSFGFAQGQFGKPLSPQARDYWNKNQAALSQYFTYSAGGLGLKARGGLAGSRAMPTQCSNCHGPHQR